MLWARRDLPGACLDSPQKKKTSSRFIGPPIVPPKDILPQSRASLSFCQLFAQLFAFNASLRKKSKAGAMEPH